MISRIYIRKVAEEVLSKGPATQFEIHDIIAEKLGRPLTPGEKRKVTKVLQLWYNYEARLGKMAGSHVKEIVFWK